MKTRLSTLLDNELDAAELPTLCADLKRSKELRGERDLFVLIGDALRGEENLHTDMTARIMHALQHEPVVLAPRRQPLWRRHVYAAVASVAGVAVVGVVAMSMQRQATVVSPMVALATSPVAQEAPKQMSKDMQEYLIAHQAQSAGFYLAGGSSQQIRTVSLVAAGDGR